MKQDFALRASSAEARLTTYYIAVQQTGVFDIDVPGEIQWYFATQYWQRLDHRDR
jgi:hypothetical protein